LSSRAQRTEQAWIRISEPWKRRVWKITAAMAAKERPSDIEMVVERKTGE